MSAAISVVILLIAGGLVAVTFSTEPTAKRDGATKKTAMLVDVVEVERTDHRPKLVAQGTVEPKRDVELRPQVDGRVVSRGEEFTPGGYVEQGERLLQIEREDFRHALAQRRSELRQAQSALAEARGQHQSAEQEYERFDEELPPDKKARVLHEPQLEAAKEQVEAARAAVEQARLQLRRTSVEAPFDAHVVRRDANVGSQVSSGESVARLVGLDSYWVGVELPLSKLRWVSVAGEGGDGSEVRIRNEQAWPADTHRTGRLARRVGVLDDDTRMARLLAEIPDPLARDGDDKPALVVGEFVEVAIDGKKLADVVRLDRDHVRKDDTVWVMEDGELRIVDAEIEVWDDDHAYVTEGLDDGDRVVTTNISTVTEGAALRVGDSGEGASGE